jgi:hypothetical protein
MPKKLKPKVKARLLLADCRQCPTPELRAAHLCTLCASKAVDENGKVFISEQPIVFEGGRR